MPIAMGTAITRANTELSTVTWKRSRMPKRRLSESLVTHSVLGTKLAWLACSDGIALMIRKSAIRAMAPMMVAPAATAMDLKTVSPQRLPPCLNADPVPGLVGMSGVSPICVGSSGLSDEPTAVESGVTAMGW